jgi:predicted nucleic acid-binding protein
VPLPPSPIGFDATVLINFCEVGRLDLLVAVVPPPRYVLLDVLEELENPACRELVEAYISRGEMVLTEIQGDLELRMWARYTLRLDAGESATLAAAVSRGWSIASDDRAARRVAESELGPGRLTGTVGILRGGVETGVLTLQAGNGLLRNMIAAGYRSPVRRLDDGE